MEVLHTASRLHFGLFRLSAEACWPDAGGAAVLPARQYGGVGLMVEAPGVRVRVEDAATWSATGPLAERALAFAHTFAASLDPHHPAPPQRLTVEQAPPEHAGLGVGTQLGLAVAHLLARRCGLTDLGVAELARRVGRGRRSALGVHGFARGGFLVEAGKRGDELAPLVARADFPEAWRVILALPPGPPGLHGVGESQALLQLPLAPLAATDALCRLVLLGMLPALAETDEPTFGAALYDYNRRVGEWFAPVQGGVYASAGTAAVVEFVRQQGVAGVGQSSWGPAVFAVVPDVGRAEDLARRLRQRFGLEGAAVTVTRATNRAVT
jgi:beta-RFAP synthase